MKLKTYSRKLPGGAAHMVENHIIWFGHQRTSPKSTLSRRALVGIDLIGCRMTETKGWATSLLYHVTPENLEQHKHFVCCFPVSLICIKLLITTKNAHPTDKTAASPTIFSASCPASSRSTPEPVFPVAGDHVLSGWTISSLTEHQT